MPRYIDAEYFAERLKVSPAFPNYHNGLLMRDIALDILVNMPTADVVEVVRGEWVKDGDFLICIICESEINIRNSLGVQNCKNYCPNCGAKMDGEEQP